ncbi:acetylglutamate kinase [Longimicrobium sp.]|uniref:acetylglutamate kinase n=1 Tax=Longimicrobium sp. TaxID=2029185 RepID=UPI002E366608|nr:acetylglutamate kinase [Longimicrobium sp.]HEX6038005.1 acetylglutamate kinase [Longimicrobium sp.]
MTRIVKIGGNRADDGGWIREVAAGIAASNVPTVLVHGGGKDVTELQRAVGIEPEWRDGLRVTTPRVMEVVRMVLSGGVNKRWVAALMDAGADALGISGEDGGLLRGVPLQGGALGRAGEVTEVRTALLDALLAQGLTPVVSPVTRGPDGGGLNVNADDAATAVAMAMGAAELLFVSDVPGVKARGAWVDALDAQHAAALLESGEAAGGMRPKLRAAMRARAAGVGRVRIGALEMLTDSGAGTRIEITRETAHAGD